MGDVGGKVYVYEKEGFGGEFLIQMKEDNTFEYHEGFLSHCSTSIQKYFAIFFNIITKSFQFASGAER